MLEMATTDIYSKGITSHKCVIYINEVGKNLDDMLEQYIKNDIEGKCSKGGYVKVGSVKIISYSSGKIFEGSKVQFDVIIEALYSLPVEGMIIDAIATNITKAGIKASIPDTDPSPVIIFISRDHFHTNDYFNTVKENDNIKVSIIGQRFELNDKCISGIGELVEPVTEQPVTEPPVTEPVM